MSQARRGFTLIELSIVLVIIGLIVAGVLTGRDLIEAARLKRVGIELEQMQTAISSFKVKYNCLPGDCANATDYFGLDPTCPSGSATVPRTMTCNGDGDGFINPSHNYNGPVETAYAFQQLGLASLIPGSWPNGPNSNTGTHPNFTPGTSTPASSYNAAIGYLIWSVMAGNGSGGAPNIPFPMPGGLPFNSLVIQVGASATYTDYYCAAGMSAPSSQALDTKIDDGAAGSGRVIGYDAKWPSTINANTACLSSGSYSTSNATGCVLYFNVKL